MKEIHEKIFSTLSDSCPSYETIRLWVNKFKRDKTPGGPRTPEIIDKVYDMVLPYRRVKMREISEASQLSERISL